MQAATAQGGTGLRHTQTADSAAQLGAIQSAPQSASATKVLLTEDEAAAVLGVSKRTFSTLRSTADYLPAPIVLGPRLLRWSADELRAAVARMPRQTERVQPESLLRSRIDRMKATGVAA